MDRKFLEELGLEKEAIDKVMLEHGKTVNTTKQELDSVTTERDDLKSQLDDRDNQLNALKDIDPDKLKKEIADLQEANNNAKEEYEANLKDLQLTNAIKLAVNGRVHDEEVAASLIDKEKLVISDDGEFVGLDKQIESLQETKAYLFKVEETPPNGPQIVPPGNPNGGGDIKRNPFSKEHWNLTEQGKLYGENPELYNHYKSLANK